MITPVRPADLDELRAVAARLPALNSIDFSRWQVIPLLGLTNRSFRLQCAAKGLDYVLRLPGAGTERYIQRADEAHNCAVAAAAGFAPPVVDADPQAGLLLTRFVAGAHPLAIGDLRDPVYLTGVTRYLRRLHDSGAVFRGTIEPYDAIDRYLALANDPRIVRLRDAARTTRPETSPESARPCHGDPVPANWLVAPSGNLTLIDWEFSAMAEPVWDLAVLATAGDLDPAAEDAMLLAYDDRIDIARRRRLDAMRPLVRLVGAAWAAATLEAGNPTSALQLYLDRELAALESAIGKSARSM